MARILSTLPSFPDGMETDVPLLHEYSLCFYNLFGFCSHLHGIHLCICCVFEPKLLMNQQDDVTNCVFGHVTKFWPSSKKDQILIRKLANSNGRNFASFYQNSLKFSI